MAAPYPPQGAQQQHTERPLKIYGEQYVEGGALPIGVVIDPAGPGGPIYSDGQPRVLLQTGWVVIHPTEWVISNRYTGAAAEVISDEEFGERFGAGGGPPLPEVET
jgi:hypothetical protein